MSTTNSKKRRAATWLAARSGRFWIATALAMATVYPLSLGPFLWLEDRGMVSEPAKTLLRPVYVPLFMMQLLSPAERAMNWYVSLWIGYSPDELPDGTVIMDDIGPDGRKAISFVTTGAAHEDIPDGEVASDAIADGAVLQTVTAPDGRKGISFVGP